MNYPKKTEFFSKGYCWFLNTSNVKSAGFDFSEMDFITAEKDAALSKGKLRLHDIVLTTRGTIGNCAYFGESIPFEHVRINSGMVVLRADPSQLAPYFLYAFLRSDIFKIQTGTHSSGSAQPQLPIGTLRNIVIPLFGLPHQRKIAAVLTTLDSKIELNNRINAELEGMAKLLYNYWFVQFDFPISAAQAAAMGKPRLAGKPYRSSGGKMTFDSTLKREIPVGWKVSTIGETFSTHLGGTPSRRDPSYWSPDEVAWLASGEKENLFVCAPDEWISRKGLSNSAATLLPEGSVILSIVRHIRASILGIEAATNQSVIGIKETARIKH
ncbi:MAG: restriction endonuclease subunit S, partial [Verrucomicrobiota bacterium]